jgi:hypothetical protein
MDTGPLHSPSPAVAKIDDDLFGGRERELLPRTIEPRPMKWFLVNNDELETFKKVDTGSSQNLALGTLAIGIAASFFGSQFTVSAALTLHQIALFQLAPAILGPLGIWWSWKGVGELSTMTKERAAHIERIRAKGGVATSTNVAI